MSAAEYSSLLNKLSSEPDRTPPPPPRRLLRCAFCVVASLCAVALLFVATSSSVIMLTPDGGRYDELRSPILPVSNVRRIGKTADGAIAVQDLDA